MTYAADTVSIQNSSPVELYEFITPMATYRYTTFDTDFVYAANTYVAVAAVDRGALEVTATDDAQEVVVLMPASLAFVQENAYKLPRSMTMRIYRLERVSAEARLVWDGLITSIATTGRIAKIQSPSVMDDALNTEIPSARFQPTCNHFLYDGRCREIAESFDVATTVGTIAGTTITVAGVGGHPDGFFRNGEIVRAADGERRLIRAQVGTTITLNYPFRELVTTNGVTLFAGCDHTAKTCRDKFGNIDNFGGHPHTNRNWVRLVRLFRSIG
jgi:uncharacterized phage protein (TIGR02218 family)